MLRFAILQRIVELTRPFAPPSPWDFLARSAKVRSLGPNASALLVNLEEEFSSAELKAARVLVPTSDGGCALSPVLAENGAPILALTLDPAPQPWDFVNHRGSVVTTDPPSFYAPCDTRTRAVSGETRLILAAFSSIDLALLSMLGLPCTPAAGLERMTAQHLRRLFDIRDDNGESTVSRDRLAPVCREDFTLVLVNWQVAELLLEEFAGLQDVLARIDDAANAFGPAAVSPGRIKIWKPTPDQLRGIRGAVALGETELIRQRMWHSILRSSSSVSGYDAAARSRQQSADYADARRELLAAIGQGCNISKADLAARLDALHRSFDRQVVQAIIRDALKAANPIQRALLLSAAQLMKSWHESSDLVQSSQAAASGEHSSSQDPSLRATLQDQLKIVDGLVKIHRELLRNA
jgi:hypothetical protein